MVTANQSLLKWVRKQAIRAELQAMRLRGRLLVPLMPHAGPQAEKKI
jgi:hypothetical protein